MAYHQVDSREGLVHQQDRRVSRQRPRQPDPLLFATGELGRITAGHLGVQTYPFEYFVGGFAGGPAGLPLQHRHRRDIVDHPLMGHQPRVLDDVADSEAQLHRVHRGDVGAVDGDGARTRLDHAIDHAQRRRLATARWADENGRHAVGDLEAQLVHGGGAVGVHLVDIVKPDQCVSQLVSRAGSDDRSRCRAAISVRPH